MTVKIEHKIVSQAIAKKPEAEAPKPEKVVPPPFSENTERPEELISMTYKIKPPVSENALYITISDIVVNEGTEYEERRPYEMFINSKEMDHFQWIVALTRMMSAIFRKGGDLTFMIEELKSVHDPNGGYYVKGGKFMPSLVAHIGSVVEKHMKKIGLIEDAELSEGQKALIAEKLAAYEAQNNQADAVSADDENESSPYPPNATVCKKCSEKSVIIMDGCGVCLNCGDSKCN